MNYLDQKKAALKKISVMLEHPAIRGEMMPNQILSNMRHRIESSENPVDVFADGLNFVMRWNVEIMDAVCKIQQMQSPSMVSLKSEEFCDERFRREALMSLKNMRGDKCREMFDDLIADLENGGRPVDMLISAIARLVRESRKPSSKHIAGENGACIAYCEGCSEEQV